MTIHPRNAPTSPTADALAASLRALVPQIETPRLTLRAPVREDFAAWTDIFCTDRAIHMDGPFSEDDAWLEFTLNCANWMLLGHGMWTVTDKTGGVMGFVLIGFEPGDLEPELGYMLLQSAEGQGFATEAATAARDHATTRLHLPTLVSYIAPDNAASRAVAQRLGARPDGMVDGCDVWRHHPKGPQ